MEWFKTIKNTLKSGKTIPPGTYSTTCYTQSDRPYKLLLTVEQDGHGRLVVNAHTILFLNQSSTEYVYHFMQSQYGDDVVAFMQARYRIGRAEVLADYEALIGQIEGLLDQQDLSPLTMLQGVSNESDGGLVPVKLDLYPMIGESFEGNMPLAQWQALLKHARDAGVAHFVLVGGDPLAWSGVLPLVSTSEELGVVMGIVANQSKLRMAQLEQLIGAGLDHLAILVGKDQQADWPLLQQVSKRNLYFQVVFEVADDNVASTINALAEAGNYGVRNVAFEAMSEMQQANLDALFDAVDGNGLQFVPFAEMVCRDGTGKDLQRFAQPGNTARNATIVMPNGQVRSLARGMWRDVKDFLAR